MQKRKKIKLQSIEDNKEMYNLFKATFLPISKSLNENAYKNWNYNSLQKDGIYDSKKTEDKNDK